MTLSQMQIDEFKATGVLHLRGFFTEDETKTWRREVLNYFESPVTGEDWRAALRRHKSDDFLIADDPTPTTHPRLAGVYRALHADADWVGENELLVRPALEPAPWSGARAPHLDYPIAVPVQTFANTVFYLTDVESQGAAFMYWPGSHHVAWRHHRETPDDYLARGARSQDQTFSILTERMSNKPVEFTGRAGDLLIWHSFVLHSASINARPETRLAMIGRWGVARSTPQSWDFDADIWAAWNFRPTATGEGGGHACTESVGRRVDA